MTLQLAMPLCRAVECIDAAPLGFNSDLDPGIARPDANSRWVQITATE
jgi:hypothetical protein